MTHQPDEARRFSVEVVRRLRKAGHVAYWAGGCVRDVLLQRVPKDFDVATSARPEQVQGLFRRSVAVGAAFGVVRVLGPRGTAVEVATFRSDGRYTDGRHPDSVRFATPQEDAQRRDFTINGMFYDPLAPNEEDALLDFVGGLQDMKRRTIRAIGDARERFQEDKLRMLRAVRFAAQFTYELDPATRDAVVEMAPQIDVVSVERILAELRLMLEDPHRRRALELLRETGLVARVLPEFASGLEDAEAWRKVLAALDSWARRIPFALAFACLSLAADDQAAAPLCDRALERLKAANDDRQAVSWLVRRRLDLRRARTLSVSRIKRVLSHPRRGWLLDFIEAAEIASTGGSLDAGYLRSRMQDWGERDLDPAPLVTGDDLLRLGYQPGPAFKEILEAVRDEQLEGRLRNPDEAIDWLQSRWSR
jgi:poly(A) polymerase